MSSTPTRQQQMELLQQQNAQLFNTVQQLQEQLAQMQAQMAQQAAERQQPQVIVQQPPIAAPMPEFKPVLPQKFKGEMTGDHVSAFIDQMDNYFELLGLQDPNKQARLAKQLLEGQAYTWYTAQNYDASRLSWPTLKGELLQYFKPHDYEFQSRRALVQCRQTGNVRSYINTFRQLLVRCPGVDDDAAQFHFIDGLQTNIQQFVRISRPQTFASAAQYAEEVGACMVQGGRQSNSLKQQHQPRYQPQHSGPQPMELGIVQQKVPKFEGMCHFCNKKGHMAKDCYARLREQQGNQQNWSGKSQQRAKQKPNAPQTTQKGRLAQMEAKLELLVSSLQQGKLQIEGNDDGFIATSSKN